MAEMGAMPLQDTEENGGGMEVEVGGSENASGVEEEAPILSLESVNLVDDLAVAVGLAIYPGYEEPGQMKDGPEILKEMGEAVVREFDLDLESRAEWEDSVAVFLRLFSSVTEVKNTPWPNASNVVLPLLSIATLQFHARAYDALIPAKDVVRCINTGEEDDLRADRVGDYMNWQLLYKMYDFEEGMDRSLMQLPLVGDVFRKTVYDEARKMVTSVHIPADDVVVNYGVQNLETAQRVTHRLYMDRWAINKRVNSGIFAGWAKDLPDGTWVSKSKIKEVLDKQEGREEPSTYTGRPRVILEQHRNWDLDGDGVGEPYVVTVDYEEKRVLRITKREYMDSAGNLKTVDYFTNYVFFPNPEGFYGLGFGILIRHLNEAANTIINEVIDAGTLANVQGGFVLERSGLKTGAVHMERGKFQAVKANVDDIRKAIYNFDFKGPNQTLYAVLGLIYEYSKMVSSISETMTGQMPSSDTSRDAVLAVIEEGRKVFSSIHKRIHRAFKRELQKIYRLNSIYLNEKEYFKVLGDNRMPQGQRVPIGRVDFVDNYDVIPVSDPTIMSRFEKVTIAEKVAADVRQNPLTAQNAQLNYNATKRYFQALGVPSIDEVLKMPDPPPPPPDVQPEQENANFFLEQPANVLPQQDHMFHLQIHKAFLEQDQLFSRELTAEGKKLAEQHVQDTLAALYMQKMEQEKRAAMGGMGGPQGMMPNQSMAMGPRPMPGGGM
jgi:chaperonin GroES